MSGPSSKRISVKAQCGWHSLLDFAIKTKQNKNVCIGDNERK